MLFLPVLVLDFSFEIYQIFSHLHNLVAELGSERGVRDRRGDIAAPSLKECVLSKLDAA